MFAIRDLQKQLQLQRLVEASDYPSAIRFIEQTIEETPHNKYIVLLRAKWINYLAYCYLMSHDLPAALNACERGLKVWHERQLQRRHATTWREYVPLYLNAINTLAHVYWKMQKVPESLMMFQSIFEALGVVWGRTHPGYRKALSDWLRHAAAAGVDIGTLPISNEDLMLWRHVFNRTSVADQAFSISGLDDNYYQASLQDVRNGFDFDIEEVPIRASRQIALKDIVTNTLWISLFDKVRSSRVMKALNRILEQTDLFIQEFFSITSDRERTRFSVEAKVVTDLALNLILLHIDAVPELPKQLYDLVLKRKAIAFEAAINQNQMSRLADNESKLHQITTSISKLNFSHLHPLAIQVRGSVLNSLRERQEREIARRLQTSLCESIQCKDVIETLPANTALVEFVLVTRYDLLTYRQQYSSVWSQISAQFKLRFTSHQLELPSPENNQYIACVVLPCGAVKVVNLGDSQKINAAIATFRSSIQRTKATTGLEIRDQTSILEAGLQLQELILAPLNLPDEIQHLVIAPDAELSRLPWHAIPLNQETYLKDRYTISQITVGRDLIRLQQPANRSTASPPLVIANPDFDLSGNTHVTVPGELRSTSWDRELRFAPLPGTQLEGEQVAELLQAELWVGKQALKGKLKLVRSPRILAIATHGFFLRDQKHPMLNNLDSINWENPLLRSGLVFAGVNQFQQGHSLPLEAEDGILTSLDFAALDLRNTELVILSACETGLGEAISGEGVFGLQRGVAASGAHGLIMSLWKVDDISTAILFSRFFKHYLNGQPKRIAIQSAQTYLQNLSIQDFLNDWSHLLSVGKCQDFVRRLQAESPDLKLFSSPFHWASFIYQGEF